MEPSLIPGGKEFKMKKIFFILLIMPLFIFPAQEKEKKANPWEPVEFFIGKWTGVGKGGESHLNRQYDYLLGKKYIRHTNKAVFKPKEGQEKGEVHEDFGFFSYDKLRKMIIFRQFHNEGFVNQYIFSISEDGKTYTMENESIENLPAGWKARYVIKILNKDEFSESFEVAGPKKDFKCFFINNFKRVL